MQTDASSQEQLQIHTHWANHYLRKVGHSPFVLDLQTDLRGGDLLARIIQAVFESSIPDIIYEPTDSNQELDNLAVCLSYIRRKGVLLDDVTNADIHTGNLDAIFSLFYALSKYRQKIKRSSQPYIASAVKPQTSTRLHGTERTGARMAVGQDRAPPTSVPPKQKKPIPNGEGDPTSHRRDYIRAFGYKETARKPSLEDTESAPVSRGGCLDRKPLREDRYLGRTGDSFREEGQGWRMRYGMTGFLTPQHEVKNGSNWISVREASRQNRRASKNLNLKELDAFLEKGEIPHPSNEGKKLPALSPKPMPGRLDGEEEVSFSSQPIVTPETESVALRHSSVTYVSDSAPPSAAWAQVDIFSSKFLSADPATHECSSAGTPPPSQETNQNMEHTFSFARSPIILQRDREGPTPYPLRRGDSFLSDDRFTTASLSTEHEPAPDPVPTIMASLGPSQITTCLVNSNRLPSPKIPQTPSLNQNTGTTESDLSSPSPDPVQSFQASPLVRGVLERPQDREERGSRPGGLVGWATNSPHNMSTPKHNSRKKLPLPDPAALKRATEWNNKSPRDRSGSPQASEGISSPFPAPSLSRRVSTRDTDCWSWGPPPLSTDRSSRSAGPSERSCTRWRDRSCWSPPAISTLISEEIKPSRGVTPVTMDTVSIPPTVVSKETRYSLQPANRRDSVYNNLLFAQDQLARKDEELRELRERLELVERTALSDTPLTPVSSGMQGEGQFGEKKKKNRTKRWRLLGRARSQKGDLDIVEGVQLRMLQRELERLRQETAFLREENSRLKRRFLSRGGTETPAGITLSPPRDSLTSSSPSTGQPLHISLIVLTRDHHDMKRERRIGAGRLELTVGELSWERLDREVVSGFMSHLKCIDPLLLGLEDDVVSAYLLGTTWRHVGGRPIGTEGPLDILRDISRPEILIDLRALSLSNLSYQLLIPTYILQQYVEVLLRQRRILVLGPPGTGKSHLVESLGQYVCLVSASRLSWSDYKLFSLQRSSMQDIMQTLSMTIKLESPKGKVFVFDGLEQARDLDEICSLLLSEKTDPPLPDSPYIIATLRSNHTSGLKPVLQQHGLWVFSYLWHKEPVLGLLGRLLRQKLLHLQISDPDNMPTQLSIQMVVWLPSALEKINCFIDSSYTPAAVFGPELFLSCPLGKSPVQMVQWFSHTWSDLIIPMLNEAGSMSRQHFASTHNLMKEIIESCPIKYNTEGKQKQFLGMESEL